MTGFVSAQSGGVTNTFGWRLGPAAWSFNRFTFFEAVDKTAALGLHYIEAFEGQRISPEMARCAEFFQRAVADIAAQTADVEQPLRIGWATTDITPPKPVALIGQLHKRISMCYVWATWPCPPVLLSCISITARASRPEVLR